MSSEACPCGSGQRYDACCGPILDGAPAPTALALMRSRYTAFTRADGEYLVRTHDPQTRGDLDPTTLANGAKKTEWLGLEIVATSAGGEHDDTGIVEFIARGRPTTAGGIPFAQHERSRFRRVDGNWLYVDGITQREPARREATPGRNDPCPCGSGKKYKRCHGG